MDTKTYLEGKLKEGHNNLVSNYHRLGLRASGKFERELQSELIEKPSMFRMRYSGALHTDYMVFGRNKNRNQSEDAKRKWIGWAGSTFLKQWVADKGLNINPFAVAHKIANEGIKVPNQNNSGRLLSDTFTPAWLDTLASEAAGHQLKEVKTLFLNKLDI